MEFRCEDLQEAGLVLVPPSSAGYAAMRDDIERRVENPPEGFPPKLPAARSGDMSAEDRETTPILENRSAKPVAAFTVVRRFEEMDGKRTGMRTFVYNVGRFPSLLLPFGLSDERRKFAGYWDVILPGSKRLLGANAVYGNNSDVRLPGPGEVWIGGVMGGGGGGGARVPARAPSRVTLTLDGAFFTDGEFAGPNSQWLWERITQEAEERLRIAKVARQGHDGGLAPKRILAAVEEVTGPAPALPTPPVRPDGGLPDFRRYARETTAGQIARQRAIQDDDTVVYMLLEWADAPLPQYRRR